MEKDRLFLLKIISPDRIFYEGNVFMVELTTSEGDVGIYKDHIPLTSIVVPCVITITEEGDKKKAAIHGGFMEVQKDEITILAEAAEWPDEIDINRAKEAKIRAERRLHEKADATNMGRAQTALQRAIARISAAGK